MPIGAAPLPTTLDGICCNGVDCTADRRSPLKVNRIFDRHACSQLDLDPIVLPLLAKHALILSLMSLLQGHGNEFATIANTTQSKLS